MLLFMSAIAGLLALAGWSAFKSVRESVHRAGTLNRLRQIQLALDNYYSDHRCYPPQYLADTEGRPQHSWRVLILKYINPELYKRYKFDEPWNGPHNRLLASEMPAEYRSPFLTSNSTVTQYIGIAGKETPWRGTTPLSYDDLRSSVSESAPNHVPLIWFVEAANSDIKWMEPRDMPYEQAVAGINVPGGRGVQSNYADALPAEIKPFGQAWVRADITPETFRTMLRITEGTNKAAESKKAGAAPNASSQDGETRRPTTSGRARAKNGS